MLKGILSLSGWGRCVLCEEPTGTSLDICQYCVADLPKSGPGCLYCAQPLAPQHGAESALCGRCARRVPPLEATLSVCAYRYPADMLVTGLKFRHQLSYGRVMGQLLAREVGDLQDSIHQRVDCLVPVPLSRWRYWQRGFNQSAEITLACARKLEMPVFARSLQRLGHQPAQAGLSAAERRSNVHRVFQARNLENRHVALVDDVMTTGSTLFDAARAARRAGAISVVAWVFARAR